MTTANRVEQDGSMSQHLGRDGRERRLGVHEQAGSIGRVWSTGFDDRTGNHRRGSRQHRASPTVRALFDLDLTLRTSLARCKAARGGRTGERQLLRFPAEGQNRRWKTLMMTGTHEGHRRDPRRPSDHRRRTTDDVDDAQFLHAGRVSPVTATAEDAAEESQPPSATTPEYPRSTPLLPRLSPAVLPACQVPNQPQNSPQLQQALYFA